MAGQSIEQCKRGLMLNAQCYWGKPEQSPHKWYIEFNLLHSDGTAYVLYSNSKRHGK